MTTHDDEIRRALEELRRDYLAELPALLKELSDAISQAKECAAPDCLRHAISKAHALRGTSGSYRFREVSDAAGIIEDALLGIQAGWLPREQAWPAIDDALRTGSEAIATASTAPASEPL